MKDKDRLMITEFTYWKMPTCPIFLYYWKPHEILILPTVDKQPKTDNIMVNIRQHRISWLVVVGSTDPKKNPTELVNRLKKTPLKDPKIVGWCYVWNTENIWKK